MGLPRSHAARSGGAVVHAPQLRVTVDWNVFVGCSCGWESRRPVASKDITGRRLRHAHTDHVRREAGLTKSP